MVDLERIVSGNGVLERGGNLFVQCRKEHVGDKLFEDSPKQGHVLLEPGWHNGCHPLNEGDGGLEEDGDVEGVGGNEGAVVGCRCVAIVCRPAAADDIDTLACLEVDKAGD